MTHNLDQLSRQDKVSIHICWYTVAHEVSLETNYGSLVGTYWQSYTGRPQSEKALRLEQKEYETESNMGQIKMWTEQVISTACSSRNLDDSDVNRKPC